VGNKDFQQKAHLESHMLVHSSSSGADTLIAKSFGLLNDLFPFSSILDADDPVFNLNLTNILFDVILPSLHGSSL
jgi:hypothetical protein